MHKRETKITDEPLVSPTSGRKEDSARKCHARVICVISRRDTRSGEVELCGKGLRFGKYVVLRLEATLT